MRFLALDIGSKSLGIAISDQTNNISVPLENFQTLEYDEISMIEKIKQLVLEKQITNLIIGYPTKTNGEKATISFYIDKIIELVKHFFNGDIKLYDERFTTKRASELSKNNHSTKDMYAATLMLNDFLLNMRGIEND